MHNSRFWLHGNGRKKRLWFSGIGWAVSPQNANLRCSSRFSGRKSGTTARCTAAISIDQETETQVRNCIKFESVLASIAAENLPGIPPFPAQVLLSAVPKQTENARVRARKCLFSLVCQILRTSWRSGRDSNPRYAFGVYSLSRRAPSTTRPPLRMRRKGCALALGVGECKHWRTASNARNGKPMRRTFGHAPDAGEIEELARAALARLPDPFRGHLRASTPWGG